jgi:DNA polymerase III epsilon subunit-like protein
MTTTRKPIILVFDTETTGRPPVLPGNERSEYFFKYNSDPVIWPRIVQLGYILYDTETMTILKRTHENDDLVRLKDDQYPIPPESVAVHRITDEMTLQYGKPINVILDDFIDALFRCTFVVGHNIQYDINVICAELSLAIRRSETPADRKKVYKNVLDTFLKDYRSEKKYCTMRNGKAMCNLPAFKYEDNELVRDDFGNKVIDTSIDKTTGKQRVKGPSLTESHQIFFKQNFSNAHNALIDVAASLRVYMFIAFKIDVCKVQPTTPSNVEICGLLNPVDLTEDQIPARLPGSEDFGSVVEYMPVFANDSSESIQLKTSSGGKNKKTKKRRSISKKTRAKKLTKSKKNKSSIKKKK